MVSNVEKAQIMFKLARKNNWGNKYDRTEHFKRFPNLDEALKELSKLGWLITHKKPKFIGISLENKFKKEIIEFIETNLPSLGVSIK